MSTSGGTAKTGGTRDGGSPRGARKSPPKGNPVRWIFAKPIRAAVAAVLAGVLGWGIPYTAPGIWDSIKSRIGVDTSPIDVTRIVTPIVGPIGVKGAAADIGASEVVVPLPPHEVRRPPGLQQTQQEVESWIRWAHSVGAVSVISGFELVVEGRSAEAVTLTGLTVDVVERRAPLVGTYVPAPGGGTIDERLLLVVLDDPPIVTAEPNPVDSKPWSFPLKVSSSDPEGIRVWARAPSCYCTWVANLHYVYQGKRGSTRIDNNGQPFRTTSKGKAVDFSTFDKTWPGEH